MTVGFLVLLFSALSSPGIAQPESEATVAETPIDLTKAKRGSCRRGELEVDRGCVQFPKRIKNVSPTYPYRARREREDGSVSLSLTLDQDGRIVQVTVSGALPKNLGFEEAALDAARKWEYEPALLIGNTVPVIFTVRVDFSVSG